jgi:Iron-containing redox enzyme
MTFTTSRQLSAAQSRVEEVKAYLRGGAQEGEHWLQGIHRPLTSRTASAILNQYYYVNRSFVLGIIGYAGRLSEILTTGSIARIGLRKPSQLEDVIATIVKISADECHAGDKHSGQNMHHNLLRRLASKAGLEPSQMPSAALTQQTASLVRFIDSKFHDEDPFLGLAMVSAVEGVALPMIRMLHSLFSEYVSPEGARYEQNELEHFELHLKLEIEHAQESTDIYEHIPLTEDMVIKIRDTAGTLYQRFGSFWRQF